MSNTPLMTLSDLRKSIAALTCTVVVLAMGSLASAAIVQTNSVETDLVNNDEASESNNNPVISPLFDTISNSDLLDNTVGSVASTVVGSYTADSPDYGLPEVVLTDGLQGIEQEGFDAFSGYSFDGDGVWQITYNLDTATNTLGYDITDIGIYAAGPGVSSLGVSRGDIEIVVAVELVGGGGFTSLGTFQNFDLGSDRGGSKIILTDDTGTIATGVSAIRFSVGGTLEPFYREFDAVGQAVVIPEPATMGLLLAGGLCVLSRRRRA